MMHNNIKRLRKKSGFQWDDENGMGVMEDMQQQWDDMVKMHGHMSSLLMTANYY